TRLCLLSPLSFFLNDSAPPAIYTLSLHDALPIYGLNGKLLAAAGFKNQPGFVTAEWGLAELPVTEWHGLVFVDESGRAGPLAARSEEHTSELQSLTNLVCRLLLEKKKQNTMTCHH